MTPFSMYGVRLVREGVVNADVAGVHIRGPRDLYEIGRAFFAEADREMFIALTLSTSHDVTGLHVITVGVLDGSLVHPREVFKPAILASAAAIVIMHNHPSGDPTPSPQDSAVTRQLAEAGQILGIPVLDHVIIGDGRYCSFVEAGLMEPVS